MAAPGIGPGALWAGLANLPLEVKNYQQAQEERTRRLKREDVQTSRQDQVWADYESQRNASQADAEARLKYGVDPSRNPVDEGWAFLSSHLAPPPTANQPAVASPNPAAGPAVTTPGAAGMAQIGLPANPVAANQANMPTGLTLGRGIAPPTPAPTPQGPGPTQGAPQAQTQAPLPMPPEWAAIKREYINKVQTPLQDALVLLQARGEDTPEARAKLMEKFEGRNQDFEKRFQDLAEKTKNEAVQRQTGILVSAMQRHDDATIKTNYGPDASWGMDPRTGLDAVKIPVAGGGFAYIGQDVALADTMFKAHLIKGEDYTKVVTDSANNQAKLMEEKQKEAFEMSKEQYVQGQENRRASMRVGEEANKEIEVAREIERRTNELNDPKTPNSAKPGIQAALDRLNAPVTRANAYANFTHDSALARLDKQGQDEVNKAITQASGNILTGTGAISPQQAVTRMMEFVKKDPTGGRAIAYLTGLNPEQAEACKAKLDDLARSNAAKPENEGDVGGNKAPASNKGPVVGASTKLSDNTYRVGNQVVTVNGGKVVSIE